MNDSGKGAEAGLGEREESRRLSGTTDDAEHGAEKIMQVAERVALGRLLRIGTDGGVRGVPVLMSERRLLRKQYGDNEDNAPQAGKHRALIVATSPGTPLARR